MGQYKCIKELTLQKVDDDEFEIENEVMVVEEGSEWFLEDYAERWDEVTLRSLEKDDYSWMKISKTVLDYCFEEF